MLPIDLVSHHVPRESDERADHLIRQKCDTQAGQRESQIGEPNLALACREFPDHSSCGDCCRCRKDGAQRLKCAQGSQNSSPSRRQLSEK